MSAVESQDHTSAAAGRSSDTVLSPAGKPALINMMPVGVKVFAGPVLDAAHVTKIQWDTALQDNTAVQRG